MKILITGGSGFIGTNCVSFFTTKAYEILNIDIKEPRNKEHLKFWKKGDICSLDDYLSLVQGFKPDLFLHLAARTDLNEEKELSGYNANIIGVENTIKVIQEVESIKRTVFASSRLVCKIGYVPLSNDDYCPPNLYGESKVVGEKIINQSQIKNWTIVRPTSIWGPWFEEPYKIFFNIVKKRQFFLSEKMNINKSFGFVGNTVYQLERILKDENGKLNKKTIYLCDYPPLNLVKWANLIREEFGVKKFYTIPILILAIIAKVGDILKMLKIHFPLTSFRLDNLLTEMVYDTKDIEDCVGSLPYSLYEGVRETVDWLNIER
jgi:GlcNAc-P-P-Und epimerase